MNTKETSQAQTVNKNTLGGKDHDAILPNILDLPQARTNQPESAHDLYDYFPMTTHRHT